MKSRLPTLIVTLFVLCVSFQKVLPQVTQLCGAPLTPAGHIPNKQNSNLDGFGSLQRLFWGDPDLPLPQQLLGEVRDVTAGDRGVFNAAADDVTFGLEHRGDESEREKGRC